MTTTVLVEGVKCSNHAVIPHTFLSSVRIESTQWNLEVDETLNESTFENFYALGQQFVREQRCGCGMVACSLGLPYNRARVESLMNLLFSGVSYLHLTTIHPKLNN